MFRIGVLTVFCFIGIVAGFVACDSSDLEGIHFDRGPMLNNIGNNIIIPAYENMLASSEALSTAATSFTTTPDAASLNTLREIFFNTYKAWQYCAPYEFGPAEAIYLRSSVNTYPTNKSEINSNIGSGTYDFNSISSVDAKGLPALDYLLYGLAETDEAILAFYTTDSNASKYKQYILDLVADINARVSTVYEGWIETGGNYISAFVSKTGNDVGSSSGILVNSMNQYYERDLRDLKIGYPVGIRSLGVPLPNYCEALYSKNSIALANESLIAMQNLFLGFSDENGIGFDDYLVAVGAQYNNKTLAEAIDEQFTTTINKVTLIPEPFSQTVENAGVETDDAAYVELQKLAVLLKAEMPSKLGILITYQDNDGD
jgi:predicted lipoprotein